MKSKVYSHNKLIGNADLQVGDRGMGHLLGEFDPTAVYFDHVQKTVWDFTATKKPDYKKWNSLRLNVQLENGFFLHPSGGYTIDDHPVFPNDPMKINIAGVDSGIIHNFFDEQPPMPFLEEPWENISIEQKIGSEMELCKEIGLDGPKWLKFLFGNEKKHGLSHFEFSALGKFGCNDDVLFSVRKAGFDKNFAVIHLTWKGKREIDGFPATEFFRDFDEFKCLRMYPDKTDWEY